MGVVVGIRMLVLRRLERFALEYAQELVLGFMMPEPVRLLVPQSPPR